MLGDADVSLQRRGLTLQPIIVGRKLIIQVWGVGGAGGLPYTQTSR
jgi:hypothetical protein